MKIKLVILLLVSFTASGFTDEEERWLNEIDNENISETSEGQLRFLDPSSNINTLHSTNTLIISQKSIDDGWVDLHQCYINLDQLPEVDITYFYKTIKNLKIISINNIDSAEVKKQNITLKNIKKNPEICVSAEVRVFYQNPDLTFSLINGPYHRRFLDGYYPYHITLNIKFPGDILQLQETIPEQTKNFLISVKRNSLLVDTTFEGILNIETKFKLIDQH